MNDACAACSLVQIIHILRDDSYIILLLHFRQTNMACIRFATGIVASACIVELENEGRIAPKPIDRGHILDGIILPQSVGITKSRYAAFGTHACATQDDESFLIHVISFV